MKRTNCSTFSLVFAALLVALLAWAGPAVAQDETASGQSAMKLEVLAMSWASADDVASVVRNLGLDASLSVDERTNSIIIRARPDVIEMVKRIAGQLDVKLDDEQVGDETIVKVYALKYAAATGGLAQRLEQLFSPTSQVVRRGPRTPRGVRIAYDGSTNQIIARGPKELVTMLDAVVDALDRKPSADGAGAEMRVRLVWLIGGAGGDRQSPPADLRDVLAELSRLGIDDLSLAAQTIIRVSSGEQFETQFVADLTTPWHVEFEGTVGATDKDARKLSMQLRGQPLEENMPGTRLSTSITTVSGHFVVLGATPIGAMDSVFVLQVTDME